MRAAHGQGKPTAPVVLHAAAAEGEVQKTLSGQAVGLDLRYGLEERLFESGAGVVTASFSGGYGEGFLPIAFTVEGAGIASITYTAEDCRFVEFLVIRSLDDYPRSPDGIHRPGIDLDYLSLPYDNDGRPGVGTGFRYLGKSYTVSYEDQLDKDYRIAYPLTRYAVGESDGGVVVWQREEEDPWIWPWKHQPEDWPSQTYDYVAQEARITVEIAFADGSVQRQFIRLSPQAGMENTYPFGYFLVVLEQESIL